MRSSGVSGVLVSIRQPLFVQGVLLRARANAQVFFGQTGQRQSVAGPASSVPSRSVERCVVALRVREWRSVSYACGPDPRSVLQGALRRSRRAAVSLRTSSIRLRLATLAKAPETCTEPLGNTGVCATAGTQQRFAYASRPAASRVFRPSVESEDSMPVREGEWRPLSEVLSSVLLRLDGERHAAEALTRPN